MLTAPVLRHSPVIVSDHKQSGRAIWGTYHTTLLNSNISLPSKLKFAYFDPAVSLKMDSIADILSTGMSCHLKERQ